MKTLKLYKIKIEYINYLKQFESNIMEPKESNHERPYVGILAYENEKFYYFAPLTSKTNKPEFYCVKIFNEKNQPFASVRVNNMIPILKTCTDLFQIINFNKMIQSSNAKDRYYGDLLKQEWLFLNRKEIKTKLFNKADEFIKLYNVRPGYKKISNNFKLLEQKAIDYAYEITINKFKPLNR